MVLEKPVIDKGELARAIDPFTWQRWRGLAKHQAASVLSPGLEVGGSDDPGVRKLKLYCSLNRDAVAALRRGRHETAREIQRHAARIEETTLGPWLEALTRSEFQVVADEETERLMRSEHTWVDRMMYSLGQDANSEIAEPIWRAAQEVAQARETIPHDETTIHLTAARVWRIDEAFAELRPLEAVADGAFSFLTDEVLAAGLRLGDPVIVRHEEVSPGILLTTLERGLERTTRASRVSGQPLPHHLEQILKESRVPSRKRRLPPLRRVA